MGFHFFDAAGEQSEDLEPHMIRGILYKRKDFIEHDEAARAHPNRTYYYRKIQNGHSFDKIVESASKKVCVSSVDDLLYSTTALY